MIFGNNVLKLGLFLSYVHLVVSQAKCKTFNLLDTQLSSFTACQSGCEQLDNNSTTNSTLAVFSTISDIDLALLSFRNLYNEKNHTPEEFVGYYVGIKQKRGAFYWTNGDRFRRTVKFSWDLGQPSRGPNENCAMVRVRRIGAILRLHDEPCRIKGAGCFCSSLTTIQESCLTIVERKEFNNSLYFLLAIPLFFAFVFIYLIKVKKKSLKMEKYSKYLYNAIGISPYAPKENDPYQADPTGLQMQPLFPIQPNR